MENPLLPTFLYKYLGSSLSPTDNRIPFLEVDRLIRFTQPTSFNDPFEALPLWSLDNIDDETIEEIFVGLPCQNVPMTISQREKLRKIKHAFSKEGIRTNPDRYKEMLSRIARNSAVKNTGILSLSALWDSGLMWAHYTNNEGICIGFDTKHDFFRNDLDNLVYEVEYPEVRPVAHVSILKGQGLAEILYKYKAKKWDYEEEYRLVRPLVSSTKIVGTDTKKNPVHLFEVPIEAVAEVHLGPCCTKELRDRVIEWHSGNRHIGFFETVLSDKDYAISRNPLH